jgi:pyruvate formate lyase activating enzyme
MQQSSSRMSPQEIVDLAVSHGVRSIAFTYNEPTIWAEFVIDIARAAHEAGLRTVMVSNGYITREAFFDVYEHIDAANIDLKGFTENFYAKITLSHLAPVLDAIRWMRRETGVWFELSNLLIPGLNDEPEEVSELCAWILGELGDDVPLHFTAFHPDFKMLDREPTSPDVIHRARQQALAAGLKYAYEGNILTRDGGNTQCPSCRRTLIRRTWHRIEEIAVEQGHCRYCNAEIAGEFD